MRPHAGIGQSQAHRTLSTAINAIHISFHANVRADRWMLYQHHSTFAGDGMTHSECRVYDVEGDAARIVHGRRDGAAVLDRAPRRRADLAMSLTTGARSARPQSRRPLRSPAARRARCTWSRCSGASVPSSGSARSSTANASLLVHRAGHRRPTRSPAEDVRDVPASAEPAALGYVRVPWSAATAWYEEEEAGVRRPPAKPVPPHRLRSRAPAAAGRGGWRRCSSTRPT